MKCVRARSTILVASGRPWALSALSIGCGTKGDTGRTAGPESTLVFAKRSTPRSTGTDVNIDVAGGNGQVIDYERYVPGGGVYVLSPARPDGKLTNLTADFPHGRLRRRSTSRSTRSKSSSR